MEHDIQMSDIKCGENYTLAIDYGGNLFAWGDNADGQLGDGITNSVHITQLIAAFEGRKVVEIDCGRRHSYGVVTISMNVYLHQKELVSL